VNHFFDIGANVGQTFDWFLCTAHEFDGWAVWCFEPSPRHLPALIERANKEGDRFKIRICPFGLSGRTETIRFHEKNDPRGDSFEANLATCENIHTGYEIYAPTVSISEFIYRNINIAEDQIVIKCDAEGAEYYVLPDLQAHPDILQITRRIMVEWHHCDSAHKSAPRDDVEKAFLAAGHPLEGWPY
jgi:FkbM family methyltransferase